MARRTPARGALVLFARPSLARTRGAHCADWGDAEAWEGQNEWCRQPREAIGTISLKSAAAAAHLAVYPAQTGERATRRFRAFRVHHHRRVRHPLAVLPSAAV